MVVLDMSEYMERHTVSRLLGSPPGYVGYEEGGQLTERVRRRPYTVVLFDEIEKAHPEVFNALLQVLENGRLTDAKGRTVDFRNTVLIMTSNVGAHEIQRQGSIGFRVVDDEKQTHEDMKKKVTEELRRTFRPEFLNRIDEVIVFHALNKEHIRQIVDIMLNNLAQELQERGVSVEFTDAAKELLANEGYDPQFGAAAAAGYSAVGGEPVVGGDAAGPLRRWRHHRHQRRRRRQDRLREKRTGAGAVRHLSLTKGRTGRRVIASIRCGGRRPVFCAAPADRFCAASSAYPSIAAVDLLESGHFKMV